jgi:tetratricopeptide (TPR) repeat protein
MIALLIASMLAHEAPSDRLPSLSQQVHAHPESAVALFDLAEMYWRSGQSERANEILKGMPQLRPAGWHWLQGVLAESQGDFVSAERAFRRELEMNNPRSDAFPGLARVLEAQDRLSEAGEAFFRAACAFPNPDDYLKAAQLARLTGQPALAEQRLQHGLQSLGPAVSLRFERVEALAAMGESQAALQELDALLELAPRHLKWRKKRIEIQEETP